jgi:hypothetical protein
MTKGVEGYCKRPIQCLASSELLTPTSYRPASVYPPAFGAGVGHPRWVERGWGVNSSEDAIHYSLYSLYVSTLWLKGCTVSLFDSQCQISNMGLSAVIQRKRRATALNVVCPAGTCF